MKKIILLTAVLLNLFFYLNANSQYVLKPAFPNLAAFSLPIELVHAFDGTDRLFVVQQRGLIFVFNNSSSVSTRKTFLNLSAKVSPTNSEGGLLGLAFHPNYESNRYFYVNYTFDSASVLRSRISRFTTSLSNPDSAVAGSELILFTLVQPFSNHNGGKVLFGPDGYLYLSFGDGGSGGDPQGNGQNRATFLGKILRINVDSASNGNVYAIPPTNPYYQNQLGYKEEIYCYGLRNTWKFSFDFPTNRLYGADVGQITYEEINIIENGKNYGWNKMEGFHCYGTCDTTGKGFVRPIFEYNHDTGLSVTGGYVYRGNLMPDLYGKYIYGDYNRGKIWALTYDGVNPVTNSRLLDTTFFISSFGIDKNNELLVCSYANGIICKLSNTSLITLNLKMAIEGLHNTGTNTLNKKDSVKVFVHQLVSPYTVLDSSKTTIDSLTYSGVFVFKNAPTGKYYLRINNRNTMETWSKAGGDSLKRGDVVSYDFTSAISQAYGSNQTLKGSLYCMYSGDVNQDDIVDLSDIGTMDNDVFYFTGAYSVTDLNSDGIVDIADMLIADNNSTSIVSLIRP